MWWRRLIFAGIALLVAGALFLGFRPQPLEVETAVVTRAPLAITISEEGKTRVGDRFVVSSPIAAFAGRVDLDAGDPIARGDTIVELRPLDAGVLDPRSRAEAEARLSAAEARLHEAEAAARAAVADAEYAASELERLKRLHQDGTMSLEELQRAETAARRTAAHERSAQFTVEVARHEVELAQTTLRVYEIGARTNSYETIRLASPVDGRILRVFRESEGTVQPGEPFVEIGDPSALEVEVEVLSRDAVRIEPGMKVVFERWGGDEDLLGRVRVVEPGGYTKISALGVEEQRVLIICDFVSPEEERRGLADGYRVEARFIVWEGDDVLQTPSSALFRHGEDGWAVYVLDTSAGVARLTDVEIGRRGGLVTEIVAGLEAGHVVVTYPPRGLEDGVAARPRRE